MLLQKDKVKQKDKHSEDSDAPVMAAEPQQVHH